MESPAFSDDKSDFRRGKSVDVDIEIRFDKMQKIQIVIQSEKRIEPALKQDLGSSQVKGFPDFMAERLFCDDIGLGVFRRAEIGAEFTPADTSIGVIDVSVHHEGDHRFGMQPFSDFMGQERQVKKIRPVQQQQRLCCVNAFDDSGFYPGSVPVRSFSNSLLMWRSQESMK